MSHTQSAQPTSSKRSITLVLGGARSGKSRYAQQLAEGAGRVVFIATAEAREDIEMRSKIERHQSDRPSSWTTIEETIELGQAIRSAASTADLILIDCLTLFASNLLERFGEETAASHHAVDALCAALTSAPARSSSSPMKWDTVLSRVCSGTPVSRSQRRDQSAHRGAGR